MAITKRPVDAPLEPTALHRNRLEAGLLPYLVDGPEEVQELPADRGVGLELDNAKLLRHALSGTTWGKVDQVGLYPLVGLLVDAAGRWPAADQNRSSRHSIKPSISSSVL